MMFEMLTGRRAFDRATPIECCRAVEIANPPALTGSPLLGAVDESCMWRLQKPDEQRYPSAAAWLRGFVRAADREAAHAGAEVHEVRRLIVLPFRLMRSDPDSTFWPSACPTRSPIRSPACSRSSSDPVWLARSNGDGVPDVQKLAVEADVDLVLAGTLLRAGDQLQVSVQLFQTPSGTLLKSHIARVAWGDIFELQSQLAGQVVEALGLTLTARERRNMQRDTPASPAAYEAYLRATSGRPADQFPKRSICMRVPAADASFARDGRLGRCYRYRAKYDARQENDLGRRVVVLKALGINSGWAATACLPARDRSRQGSDAMVRL
jgi:TolB-like protein